MSQVKIFCLKEHLNPIKDRLCDLIHTCVVDALQYPVDKRAHRFFPLDSSDFYYPAGRTQKYTIIEFSMFEGRSVAAKKTVNSFTIRECRVSSSNQKDDLASRKRIKNFATRFRNHNF